MLIHLTPTIINKFSDVSVTLTKLTIPELSLTLTGDKDLVVRKPYPSKIHHVACRKKGRKAMLGLLIDCPQPLRAFTVHAFWRIESPHFVADTEHHTVFDVLDDEFDVISDMPIFWHKLQGQSFKDKRPDEYEGIASNAHFSMDSLDDGGSHQPKTVF